MDILDAIKQRASIRKYQDKPIPKDIVDKIIEAGVWGPSVPSFLRIQPWKFVVIEEKKVITSLANIILDKSKVSPSGVSLLLKSAHGIVSGASLAIAVYNSGDVEKKKEKYKESFANFAEVLPKAELCAIAATIQNMILTAHSLGVGSCWLDMPLFCKKEVNDLLNENLDLVAVVTFGYAAEQGKRASRKDSSEIVKVI